MELALDDSVCRLETAIVVAVVAPMIARGHRILTIIAGSVKLRGSKETL